MKGTVRAFGTTFAYYALYRLLLCGQRQSLSAHPFLSHTRSQGTMQISQGKTQNCARVDAQFIKHVPSENFVMPREAL